MHDIRAQMKENQNCEARCLQILKEATGMTVQEVRNKFIKILRPILYSSTIG